MQALIVDDSKIVRKVTRNMLEPMGYVVAEAEDGVKAVEYCQVQMPRLIMMDHNMPEMMGLDAVIAIRAMTGGDAPVIVMCTTMNDMDFIQSAIMGGANEFIMKPFDAEILQTKLEQLDILPSQAS
jgi:two-component system chemotaxis response regulator CheY